MKTPPPLIALALATMSYAGPILAGQGAVPAAPVHIAAAALPDFSGIVASQGRAVVNIHVLKDLPEEGAAPPETRPGDALPSYSITLGSGFVISPDGLILTNRHVVEGASKVTVKFINKLELPARIVGMDAATDIAVLKVDAKDLPTVAIGDSNQLVVGQWVLAIGAPFGLERSASQGIISTLNRALPDDNYVPFIQTDVPINPGNSGGPLFDTQGRVVGINSQILSKSGGYMGLSFAIPINTAMAVAQQIIRQGHATHGWMGISTQELNQELARAFGLPLPHGSLVTEVTPGGPGEKAGLQPGDIILALGDTPIEDSADLPPLVGASQPGETKLLTVLRDGRVEHLKLKVGELHRGGLPDQATGPRNHISRLNLSAADLDDATRQVLGIHAGVLVREIGPGPAAEAGILPGDVLMKMGWLPIDNIGRLNEISEKLPAGRPVPVMIKRRDGTLFLPLTLPADKPPQS